MQPANNSSVIFTELPAKQGRIGHILLNRPQALNALSVEIILAISKQLQQWEQDPQIIAVIIRGAGDRAFCAGGDLKELYYSGRENSAAATPFFRDEYWLNEYISKYKKPYLAMLHGIAMGGGLGISLHGSHVIAAADLKLAMPETGIGFYPDTGATFFLSHVPHNIGMYMGLTGNTITVHDAIFCGLVDHFVPSEKFDALILALCSTDLSSNAHDVITKTIEQFAVSPAPSILKEQVKLIETCFSKNSVQDVMDALHAARDVWAEEQLAIMYRRSPTSLKVTLHALALAKSMDITSCITMEFNLTIKMLQGHDIYEGIRAALIDKTHDPNWQPDSLADVNDAIIAAMFEIKCQL